jgi:hypothetical protein
MMNTLRNLPLPLTILWCYALWYLVMLGFHFEADVTLWATSLGIAIIIGFALMLSTGPISLERWQQQRWAVLRLFIIPFCVSSFSALVKGKGFVLVFSPSMQENLLAGALCAALLVIRSFSQRQPD